MTMAQKIGRIVFYGVWAVLMTALTYILGAVGLKVLRQKLGRSGFWVLCLALTTGFFAMGARPMGVAFLSLAVLMGVFTELEELNIGFLPSAFFTLLLNTMIAAGAVALWMSRHPKWTALVQQSMETLLQPLAQFNSAVQINYSDLMMQLPSIVIVLWMAAIYLAVLLEGRLTATDPALNRHDRPTMRQQLGQLRLPDPVVWILIASLLGAFGGFEARPVQVVSANLLNVTFVMFFFQGIAVVGKFFERLRMGSFWQIVFMVLIVVHLFLFVSLLGLADYWLDFRARLERRAHEFNREA